MNPVIFGLVCDSAENGKQRVSRLALIRYTGTGWSVWPFTPKGGNPIMQFIDEDGREVDWVNDPHSARADMRRRYRFPPCPLCRQTVTISSDAQKQALLALLSDRAAADQNIITLDDMAAMIRSN